MLRPVFVCAAFFCSLANAAPTRTPTPFVTLLGKNTVGNACQVTFAQPGIYPYARLKQAEPLVITVRTSTDVLSGKITNQSYEVATFVNNVDLGHDVGVFRTGYNIFDGWGTAGVKSISFQSADLDHTAPTSSTTQTDTWQKSFIATDLTGKPLSYEARITETYDVQISCDPCDLRTNDHCDCTDGTKMVDSGKTEVVTNAETCTFN